jgi:hypothetical protein
MSIKKLFDKNKKETSASKYLKKSSADNVATSIESAAHLKQVVDRSEAFVPRADYANPKEFAKFGSAEKYYENAFSHIASNYPYDGSGFEKEQFFNQLNPLEKWLLENKYPTSKGYVVLGNTYGSATSGSTGYFSSSAEYIEVKGGPHATTVYSSGSNRTNNLEFGGPSGSTVEFFYKKESGIPLGNSQSHKQVIFDAHNGFTSGSAGYGRLTIEIFSGSEDRFRVTMMSGATGFVTQSVPTTGGLQTTSGSWDFYSFVFNTSGSTPTIDFYVNGVCRETSISASDASEPSRHAGRIDLVTGSLIANLGALVTAPSGTSPHADRVVNKGYGKLSASLDEFRFWKKARNAEEVGRHWMSSVNGGANKYDANVSLGVYFKFNEGVTSVAATDKIVLDYSGRISNGSWRGYETSGIRETESALDQMNRESISEVADPIVRLPNSEYTRIKNELTSDGRQHDYENAAHMMNSIPSWIIEEDENSSKELSNITQVMSSYFDTLHLQITELSRIKDVQYISGSSSGSINEFPYNDRLVDSLGLEASEIFADTGILENYFKRDEQINFEQDVKSIKNTIYRNIYNNLSNILKSKGSEKSIRNLIRCFGVDDGIVSLNTYGVNSSYKLESQYKPAVSNKKYIDFSGLNNRADVSGTVFQIHNPNVSGSWGIIYGDSGSAELHEFGFTAECEVVFPSFQNAKNLSYDLISVVTSSLFGFHSPAPGTNAAENTDTTVTGTLNDWGLQVRAIKSPAAFSEVSSPIDNVRDVYFSVQDRDGTQLLTSSVFYNVYDNQKWNFALSVNPTKYQFATGITGSFIDTSDGYEVSFYGVNYDTGVKRNSFLARRTLSYATGSRMTAAAKRFFVGAHKTNFTGAILARSDVRASSLRYWTDVLPTGTIDLHANEVDSYGRKDPTRESYEFQSRNPGMHIPRIETLALNWDFANITGSDSSGQFDVLDRSSGSADDSYENQYQGVFSNITLRQHTGEGRDFAGSSTPARKEYVYKEELQVPEFVSSTDMVSVVSSDSNVFTPAARPTDYYYALEKSMYGNVSKVMLQLFASIDEMNNLIGEPVNTYRPNYKSMEKLRQLFFKKVGNIPDFDKYLDYYKWIDSSIGNIVEQLYPASSPHASGVRNIIESHVLERPKYKYAFLGDRKGTFPPGGEVSRGTMGSQPLVRAGRSQLALGGEAGVVSYVQRRAPLPQSPQKENENSFWWKYRAERTNPTISSSVPGVNDYRQRILSVLQSEVTSSKLVSIAGSVYKSQGIGQTPGTFKYSNIRDITFGNFKAFQDTTDDPDPKVKRKTIFEATNDNEKFSGELLVPFTAYSSSVNTGYMLDVSNNGLTGTIITNLHEDPETLQGPFTLQHVGGLQSRHVAPLLQSERREAFALEFLASNPVKGRIRSIITGSVPKGQYRRTLGAASPVNIANIRTNLQNLDGSVTGGVNPIGNFHKNYEVLQTSDRNSANMDFLFHNNLYYTSSIPTAFVSTIEMRNLNRTGSDDYYNPRNRDSLRTTRTVIASRFSSPGSKLDSKQQFRDVASDQFSPNNALPFRNIDTRLPYMRELAAHVNWGGFSGSSNEILTTFTPLAIRNSEQGQNDGTNGFGNPEVALDLLNAGVQEFGYPSASLFLQSAQFSDGQPLQFVTPDGDTYDASVDASVTPFNSTATEIGVNGLTPGPAADSDLATAISISLTSWIATLSNPYKYSVVGPTSFSDASGDKVSIGIRRNEFDTEIIGTNFTEELAEATGVTANAMEVSPKFIAKAAVHKTQRNATRKLKIFSSDHKASGVNNEIYTSSSFRYDNAFVSRPIPQADRLNWFINSVEGDDYTNTYSQYLISGSRYPQNIYINTSSIATRTEGRIADNAVLAINSNKPSQWDSRTIDIFQPEAGGLEFIRVSASSGRALDSFTSDDYLGQRVYEFGVQGATSFTEIRDSLFLALNDASSYMNYSVTVTDIDYGEGAVPVITITQSLQGPVSDISGTYEQNPPTAGNGAISFFSGVLAVTQQPTNGAVPVQTRLGQSLSIYSASSGQVNYQWVSSNGIVPWSQLRTSETTRARHLIKKNIYQFEPNQTVKKTIDSKTNKGDIVINWEKQYAENTTYAYYTDRFTNRITSSFSARYVEPPLTSKYKPLIHHVQTTRGTPSKTNYDEKMDVTLEYSYGNVLQSFANKEINIKLGKKSGYMSGEIKRPYEVLRDNFTDKVQRNTTGAELIKLMAYEETIFPRERYTYLSGTRQRLAFAQDYWRNDQPSGSTRNASLINLFNITKVFDPIVTIPTNTPGSIYGNYFNPGLETSAQFTMKDSNSHFNRVLANFTTSFGYGVRFDETAPIDADIVDNTNIHEFYGSGSIWPLDSHLFSDSDLVSYLLRPYSGSFSNNINVLASCLGTYGLGELMMPHYGRAISGSLNHKTKARNVLPGTSSINSPQYVYGVPSLMSGAKTVYEGDPEHADTFAIILERRSPGGSITLPPWTAAKERRFVDGPSKAKVAPSRFPTYETYDEYVADVRLKGKDFSIVPEFRISSQISNYKDLASVSSLVTASFELTGASENVFDGSSEDFMPRYGTTDVIEYLKPFMAESSDDKEFNKNPRHFKMESEAILKLLPYDGFYPVNRTIEIATLFSQSYADFSTFRGGYAPGGGGRIVESSASMPSRFRALSRPFFAPGILYNSIKSGVGVQFPVRRESYRDTGSPADPLVEGNVDGRVRLSDDQFLTGSSMLSMSSGQFVVSNYFSPLHGCLSGALDTIVKGAGAGDGIAGFTAGAPGQIPGNRRRRTEGDQTNFDWVSHSDTQKFFWGDVIPFEGILNPLEHIGTSKTRLVNIDFNDNLYAGTHVSASVDGTEETRLGTDGKVKTFSDLLYRMSISNFVANVPQFFLKEKKEGGFMTKFVANVPSRASKNDPAGVSKTSQVEPNRIPVSSNKAYIMEIGLKKTDNFNLYNNPYAFGPPTSTGSYGWDTAAEENSAKPITTASSPEGAYPQGKNWPLHRGEFAPFTPTYYYGPSLVRITYTPSSNKEVSLSEILNSSEISVQYVNSNGYYYDFDSGSFADLQNSEVDTSGVPFYQWNRAWQNRQDIDASIIIDNLFPSDAGSKLKPLDPNKWVVMPKWECPILDFSGSGVSGDPTSNPYNFSSSVNVGEYEMETKGIWHQYGLMPKENEGIYLYISDVDDQSTEFRLVGNPTGSGGGSFSSATGEVRPVKKVPLSVIQSGREIASLATLVGFDEKEIMPANEWDPTRAKRLGELAEDGEKTMSEAIIAIPYFYDSETDKMRAMTLKAPKDSLGPKIKEFRQAFTKYSFPPSLRKTLVNLLPPNFPKVSNFINPFGGDDYDSLLSSGELTLARAPIVYLMEHTVELSKQDLADIWQNIMPEIGNSMKTSVTAIDHYMPGERSEETETIFPEILKKELELGLPRNGHPRPDLIDTEDMNIQDGFQPEIRWFIFKVKERGQTDYTNMMIEEINDGAASLSFENMFGYIADDLPPEQKRYLEDRKNVYTKGLYHIDELGRGRNTFNWPYDFCSLIESAKITTKVGFRPELDREVEEFDESKVTTAKSKAPQPNIDIDDISSDNILLPNLNMMQNMVFAPPPIAPPAPPAGQELLATPAIATPIIPVLPAIQNINVVPDTQAIAQAAAPAPTGQQQNAVPVVSPNISLRRTNIPNVSPVANLGRIGGGNNFGGGGFGGGNFGGY